MVKSKIYFLVQYVIMAMLSKDVIMVHLTQAACAMTIEVKNLESDFYYVKEECKEEKDKAGEDLRVFGRRFVDLIDEFVPQKLTSKPWVSLQASLIKAAAAAADADSSCPSNNNNNIKATATAEDKKATALSSTVVDKASVNQQNVTIKIPPMPV